MAKQNEAIKPQDRILNVRPDPPDIRDRMYEPALIRLQASIDPQADPSILDQGREGACTGFGLAATINQLLDRQARGAEHASARMLYEMAKRHDEWPGQDYDGSSCRGAIRGWANMGVCPDTAWRYNSANPGQLTIERAWAARRTTLGAYYRLRPDVTDYHAALNEVGVLYASANVHDGWFRPAGNPAVIKPTGQVSGGHAFAIVGYNDRGFWVQNSWGPNWGGGGVALWLYEDWLENIVDGWVVRLALPVPQIFGMKPKSSITSQDAEAVDLLRKKAPKRIEIAGHFAHFDDGAFKGRGDYWSDIGDIRQTANLVKASRFKNLLIYAHGGLNSPKASATRIRALKDGFKRNRVYPFHIMYDTGLAEEVGDVVRRAFSRSEGRAAGFTDWTDGLVEDFARKPVTPLWEEMKRDAEMPFKTNGADGSRTIRAFAEKLAGTGKAIHLAGHSTGGVLIGHLLNALDRLGAGVVVESVTLFAPACRVDFFQRNYLPYLKRTPATDLKVRRMLVYNLNETLELDDNVAKVYRKSLLHLVSRAFERGADRPILGMELYSKDIPARANLEFIYSDGRGKRSASTSHGGFDNDTASMNDLLKTVLGRAAPKPFTKAEMEGY